MTLKELIRIRGNKFVNKVHATCSDFWKGYQSGWECAYEDIEEILTQNKVDTDIVVMKGGAE